MKRKQIRELPVCCDFRAKTQTDEDYYFVGRVIRESLLSNHINN